MNYAERAMTILAEELPSRLDDGLLALYALLVLTKGQDTTLKDVHNAWSLWRTRSIPNHPSLIPFEKLPEQVQELDRPYMEAIHRTADRLTTTPNLGQQERTPRGH